MTSDLLLLQQKINEKHCLTIKPTRGNKIISSSNGTGEVTRSVKRLQNTPIRRWKERARDFERRHQLTPPYRLLNKKRK
jgi:hypothetical protein